MKKMNRLPGHGLRREGKPIESLQDSTVTYGRAKCECGALSPPLSSSYKRKAWHRDHKDDLRAGGDGRVWT